MGEENKEDQTNKIKTAEILKKAANPNCSKCYGRGHRGYNITYKYYSYCQCVLKNLKTISN